MKLAISNIAWQDPYSIEARELLQKHQVYGLEIAPGKISQTPANATDEEIEKFKSFWAESKVNFVAFQALLYGQSEIKVFGSPEQQQEFSNYLSSIASLAKKLKVKSLVFGSPKNRRVDGLSQKEIEEKAQHIFSLLGDICEDHSCRLGIEANPKEYSCNFINNLTQAYELVNTVNHPGFALHIDTSSLHMNEETPDILKKIDVKKISHVHLSEPFLAPVNKSGVVPHQQYLRALSEIGYAGWVSIEMKPISDNDKENLVSIKDCLSYIKGLL